jgi:hypothetical protein
LFYQNNLPQTFSTKVNPKFHANFVNQHEVPMTQLQKAVPLTQDVVVNFLYRCQESLPDETISQLLKQNAIDLNREFRTKTFKVVHLLLQKPLREMFSTAVPDLQQCNFCAS